MPLPASPWTPSAIFGGLSSLAATPSPSSAAMAGLQSAQDLRVDTTSGPFNVAMGGSSLEAASGPGASTGGIVVLILAALYLATRGGV